MSSRVTSWNGFETALNGGIDASTATITLLSVDNLSIDTFLVIDPDIPATRDYVYVTAVDVGLKQITVRTPRPEEGSTSGTGHAHTDGAVVRAVPVHQWMDLVFDDIEASEAWQASHAPGTDPHPQYAETTELTTHEGDVSDPHAAAGYLVAADIDGKVDVAGDTMTGDLVLAGAPDADLKAATKKYVDDKIAAIPTFSPSTLIVHDQFEIDGANYTACPTVQTAYGDTVDVDIPADWATCVIFLEVSVQGLSSTDNGQIQIWPTINGSDSGGYGAIMDLTGDAIDNGPFYFQTSQSYTINDPGTTRTMGMDVSGSFASTQLAGMRVKAIAYRTA